jgi:hypothetical protein
MLKCVDINTTLPEATTDNRFSNKAQFAFVHFLYFEQARTYIAINQ